VLVPEPTFPGALIECRAIGMFRMTDEMGGDDKVLCIPVADQRQGNVKELTDLHNLMLLEIEHFFSVYKDLEPGKSVEGAVWVGHAEAEMEIRASWERARGTSYENEFTRE
jgi:inorganic pyrophosphatase